MTRILTTHAGSLPRPAALAEMHGRRSRGEPDELRAAVERATSDVINDALTGVEPVLALLACRPAQQRRSTGGTQPPVGNGRGKQRRIAVEHQPAASALTLADVIIGVRQ